MAFLSLASQFIGSRDDCSKLAFLLNKLRIILSVVCHWCGLRQQEQVVYSSRFVKKVVISEPPRNRYLINRSFFSRQLLHRRKDLLIGWGEEICWLQVVLNLSQQFITVDDGSKDSLFSKLVVGQQFFRFRFRGRTGHRQRCDRRSLRNADSGGDRRPEPPAIIESQEASSASADSSSAVASVSSMASSPASVVAATSASGGAALGSNSANTRMLISIETSV